MDDTNLLQQLTKGEFDDVPVFREALKKAVAFLSSRSGVYSVFDKEKDTLDVVKSHVSGVSLPPIVRNSNSALAESAETTQTTVMSVHPDVNSSPELRKKTHRVDEFKNVASSVGVVVSVDTDLIKELKRMSECAPDHIGRRFLTCYTTMAYLHEVAHTKVAVFMHEDPSLQKKSPKKFHIDIFNKIEAGYFAEKSILGCYLQLNGELEYPYRVHLNHRGELGGATVVTQSGGERLVTKKFIQLMEDILAGTLQHESSKELDGAVLAALTPRSDEERTPESAVGSLERWSKAKLKTSIGRHADDEQPLSLSNFPWRRKADNIIMTLSGTELTVVIEDKSREQIEFLLYAFYANGEGLRQKKFLFPRCCRNLLKPAFSLIPGTHIFLLEEYFEFDKDFNVVVVVGQETKSLVVKTD